MVSEKKRAAVRSPRTILGWSVWHDLLLLVGASLTKRITSIKHILYGPSAALFATQSGGNTDKAVNKKLASEQNNRRCVSLKHHADLLDELTIAMPRVYLVRYLIRYSLCCLQLPRGVQIEDFKIFFPEKEHEGGYRVLRDSERTTAS
jgi:hypothetical protein